MLRRPDPSVVHPADPPLPGRPPTVRNAFVGRERQLREVMRRLQRPDARVVTLVGRSGVGKTRLALETARRLTDAFPGGAAMLDASVPDERPVVDRLTAALGVRVALGQAPEEAVRRQLSLAPILLIADDIDQLAGAIDELVDLAAAAPEVRILATAARPTGHPEEHVVRLRPLSVPPRDADPEQIRWSPAVALYLARAGVGEPGTPGEADVSAIGELCRRLDGLPLAIELAAARARVLSPASQLRALEGGPLTLRAPKGDRRPERHQALRSALDVTWSMADATEQAMLRRMAVFGAPPTFETLAEVVRDPAWSPEDLLAALGSLVDLGLVEPEEQPDEPTRYRLLPTVRALAIEQLEAAREGNALRAAHAAAFLELARRTRPMPEATSAAALARESADLALALATLEADGRLDEALELASILVGLWVRVGVSADAYATFERLLAAAEAPDSGAHPSTVARGLVAGAILAIERATPDDARGRVSGWLERARSLARESGDRDVLLQALEWSAIAVPITGDVPTAIASNAEAMALATASGDQVALARCEYRSSMLAGVMGDRATSVALGVSALRRARAIDDPESIVRTAMHLSWLPPDTPGLPDDAPTVEEALAIAQAHAMRFEEGAGYSILGVRSLFAGDLPSAARWCAEGLAFAAQRGSWHAGAFCTVTLLLVASAAGDEVLVARLHGILLPVLAEVRQGQIPETRPMFEAALERARATLGEETFAREEASTSRLDWDAGIAWTASVARRLAGSDRGHGGGRDGAPGVVLTPRERDVLRVMARGLTNREIGEALGLTEKTVMHHSTRIYAKLGVRGRAEATAWAIRSGMLDGEA